MPRPKGSKNKATVARESKEIMDPVAQDFEEQIEEQDEELLAGAEEIEPDVEDDEEEEQPRIAPGMTRVADTGNNTLLEAIREQTAALTASMPQRKVLFSQFKTRSPFNPTGRRRKLKFIVYQNGYRCNPKTLNDTEFNTINSGKIRPGQYLSKIVTVRVVKADSAEDDDKIFISYNNKTPDQRMMNKDHWNGFADLLNKIVAEGEARKLRLQKRRQSEASV